MVPRGTLGAPRWRLSRPHRAGAVGRAAKRSWAMGWATYFLFMIPGLLFSLWAQSRVKGAYAKYSQVRNARGITGAQAARSVLDANGLQQVPIEPVPGNLTDHYDPRHRVLRLSQ